MNPLREVERERSVQGEREAIQTWLVRVLLCWLIFQMILAASLLELFFDGHVFSSRFYVEVATSPCVALMSLFAVMAAITTIRNAKILSGWWLVLGCVPWGLLTAQASIAGILWLSSR